jgi:Domain of unknown function (DUF1707)
MTTPAVHPDPRQQLRIGDRERQELALTLGEHHAAGRLTAAELDERIAAAWRARTQSDLDALVRDLPGPRLPGPRLPGRPRLAAAAPAGDRAARTGPSAGALIGLAAHIGGSLLMVGVVWLVWALTWTGYAWPIWPTLGATIGIAAHALAIRAVPARYAWPCAGHRRGHRPHGRPVMN